MLNINTLFLLVVMIKTQTNLICNGDLQSYITTTASTGSLNNTEYSFYAQSNASCWIRRSLAAAGAFSTSIQVKLISLPAWPVTTKGIDTASYDRYGVCQNLTLVPASKYTLKYNLILDASIVNTTFTTYVNSVSILAKIYNKTYTIYAQAFNFTANETSNLLCMQPDLINYNTSFSSIYPSYKYGPIIDNISLYLSSQLINSTTNSTTNSITNSTNNSVVNSTTNSTANSTVNSTSNVTTNSTTNSNNSTLIISNSTTNSTNSTSNIISNQTSNLTKNSTSSTNSTLVSNTTINSTTNSTTNSNNSTYNQSTNSSNSTTNITSASNSTIDILNSTTNSSTLIQNSTNNSSINQSTSNSTQNININSMTNFTIENSSTTQNTTLYNSSVNSSNFNNETFTNSSVIMNNITSNYSQNFASNLTENATLGNFSINSTSIINQTNLPNIIPNSTITPNISIPTDLPPTIPPTIPTFQQNHQDIQIIVRFKSQISSLSENIVIVSDLKPSQFGLSISAISYLRVQIQQNVQTNLIYYADKNGYLCVQFLPDSYYDKDTILGTLKIYLPQVPFDIFSYKFTVIVDGRTINLVILTDNQKYMMQAALSTMEAVSKMIQKSFLLINSVSCSYFLISLLGFYNLSLMYIFLKLKTLPNFTRIFLNTLAYVFFSKGSITGFIKDTLKIQHQINWFDFPLEQKIQSHKQQFIWFGVFGNSSNFMMNNFQPLVLLSFLLIKFMILKLILIKVLPEKLKLQLDVKPFKFYQYFLGQLSCFVPFFVVSSTECIIEMGESNWDGQLNNLIQIFVFFLFSIITIIGFCLAYLYQNRKLLSLKKIKGNIKNQKFIAQTQKHISKKRSTLQKNSYYLLCFLIPFVVIIRSNIMFFILVSPIIVWRFYSSIIILHHKKSIQNIFKLMNKIVWIVYHFGFLLLFTLELLQIEASKNMLNFIKQIGFVLIFCVLIGACIDILQAVISVIMALVEFIKLCVKSCKHKVSPCSEKSDTNMQKTQEVQITEKDTQKEKQINRQKEKTQKISQAQCLKLKIEDIQTQQKEIKIKNRTSLAQQQKIKKAKTTRIKNASTNRHITDKRLKIKELD